MNKARQTFVNDQDRPIYITIEPAPECYELEPGETLTLIYDVSEVGDTLSINLIEEGVIVWPLGKEPEVLINGAKAHERSWKFKHHGSGTV